MRRERGIAGRLTGALLAVFGSLYSAVGQAPAPAEGPERTLGSEAGFATFQHACVNCHGNPDVQAPSPAALRQLSPEAIYEALTTGVMQVEGRPLADELKRLVAESLSGRLLGTETEGDARSMPNQCPDNPTLDDPFRGPAWIGWGVDAANTRFQPADAAGLAAEQVPRLKLAWAFGFPRGRSAWGQPMIASGRVFVGADTGYVYALSAATGCVYWSFRTKAGVRGAISIGPIEGHGRAGYAVYFGDVKGSVYALDAQTGAMLWTAHPEEHYTARITAAPTLHRGRLYVPFSSWEEFSARSLDYPCCTSRGSVVALDANTGRQLWKTYTITDAPKPVRKNSRGVQLWAPAGAAVFTSPTVDVERNVVYVGTGNAYTEPAGETSDAVLALDINTGRVQWVYQVFAGDAFLVGCNSAEYRTENCPEAPGPDWDIPASPILRTLATGRRLLIVGTKPGDILALDPDRDGRLVWKVSVADGKRLNGVQWGGAADERQAYFGLTGGGAVAIRLDTGARVWSAPLVPDGVRVSHGAAATAMPGVIFVGGSDGRLHALSTADGRKLWEFDTAREFQTVNAVVGRGGGLRAPGPTVAAGMLFVGSGYAVGPNDLTGNVLLAFSAE